MSNNQTIKAICKGCGDILDEPSNLSIEERKPCPKCGSILRNHEVVITHVCRRLIHLLGHSGEDLEIEIKPT